MQKMVALLRT